MLSQLNFLYEISYWFNVCKIYQPTNQLTKQATNHSKYTIQYSKIYACTYMYNIKIQCFLNWELFKFYAFNFSFAALTGEIALTAENIFKIFHFGMVWNGHVKLSFKIIKKGKIKNNKYMAFSRYVPKITFSPTILLVILASI